MLTRNMRKQMENLVSADNAAPAGTQAYQEVTATDTDNAVTSAGIAAGLVGTPYCSTSSQFSSNSVVAQRLAAEARNAQALLLIETERIATEQQHNERILRQQGELFDLKKEAQRLALQAEIAAIESGSHCSSRTRSWVHRSSTDFVDVPKEAPAVDQFPIWQEQLDTESTNVVTSATHENVVQPGDAVNVYKSSKLLGVSPENSKPVTTTVHTSAVPIINKNTFCLYSTEPVLAPPATVPQAPVLPASMPPARVSPVPVRSVYCAAPAVSSVETSAGLEPAPSPLTKSSDITELAKVILSLSSNRDKAPRHIEIAPFTGKTTEWLAFQRAYMDTHHNYSSTENLARLRYALHGEAARAVAALLLTSSDPGEVMQALEERFARPEHIVMEELASVRALPRLQSDLKDLNTFSCRVNNLVAVIKHLNQTPYLYSPEIYYTLLGKLTPLQRALWTRYAAEHSSGRTKLETFSDFLREEARHHTQFGLLSQPGGSVNSSGYPDPGKHKRAMDNCHATQVGNFTSISCPYCKQSHELATCNSFQKISVAERQDFIRKNNRCYKCLSDRRHTWKFCRRKVKCDIDGCKYFHHRLLHDANFSKKIVKDLKIIPTCVAIEKEIRSQQNNNDESNSVLKPIELGDSSVEKSTTYACATSSMRRLHRYVYLKVIPVVISGPLGDFETYALLDDGSTSTLIDASVANIIGVSGPKSNIIVQGVGGMTREDEVQLVSFKIRGKFRSDFHKIENARAINNLDLRKQSISYPDIIKYKHLVDLANEISYEEAKPTILIGAEDWHLTISHGVRCGNRSEPVATLTLLGWVLHGLSNSKTKSIDFVNHVATFEEQSRLDALESLVREQYKLDALGVTKHSCSFGPQYDRAMNILERTTRRLPNGRFETGLLWKDDNPIIPDSYQQALSRLKTLERRMARDKDFASEYTQYINNIIEKGYAEECLCDHDSLTSNPSNPRYWYLPHFAVTHPQSNKMRVVHDAAAKSDGVSFNTLLLPGPDMLRSLLGILFRWREGKVALTADIREMFPQIKIRSEDRDMQRFLWRNGDRTATIREYRMNSMIFGAVSSPCTAIYILNKNAQEYSHLYPEAAHAIQKNTYMDDYVSSFNDIDKAAQLASDIVTLHKLSHFDMRGWISNIPESLRLVPIESRALSLSMNPVSPPNNGQVSTLGLNWDYHNDLIGFRKDSLVNIPPVITKRIVLGFVMRLYDPLGILSPVSIHGRCLLQTSWRSKVGWDEPLPANQYDRWKKWFNILSGIYDLKIPRWYLGAPSYEQAVCELHIFADASELAYACVAYWRFIDDNGNIHIYI